MDIKSITKKALEIAFGKPEAHQPGPRMNRKQRRIQQSILRKRAVAEKRKRYEGRG